MDNFTVLPFFPSPVFTGRSHHDLIANIIGRGLTVPPKVRELVEAYFETTNHGVMHMGLLDSTDTTHSSGSVVDDIAQARLLCPTIEDVLCFTALVGVGEALNVINRTLSAIGAPPKEQVVAFCRSDEGMSTFILYRTAMTVCHYVEDTKRPSDAIFLAVAYPPEEE